MSHEHVVESNSVAGPSKTSSSQADGAAAALPPTPPPMQRSATGDEVLGCPSLPVADDADDGSAAVVVDLPDDFVDREDEHANRVSMYVRAFEEMLSVVLSEESYLFDDPELATFARYRALSYNARYLLTRLMLRKPRIYRLCHLERSYAGELGRHVGEAMDELCAGVRPPPPSKVPSLLAARPLTTTLSSAGGSRVKSAAAVDRGEGLPKASARPAKRKATRDDVIDLLSTDSDDDVEVVSASASTSSLASTKRGGVSSVSSKPPAVKRSSLESTTTDVKGKGKAPAADSAPSLSADVIRALSLDNEPLDIGWFCAGVERESEQRLLRSLQMDEVREVARGMKCWRAGLTYDALVETVLKAARSQTTLPFAALVPGSAVDSGGDKQSTLPFGGSAPIRRADTGRGRLIQVIKDVMGKAIIVNPDVRKLWGRLNLVFYRSTMTPPTLLLPQILTKAQKRHYPAYTFTRTLSLFPTRGALLAYEKALLLETEVDDALGEQETLNGRRPFSKTQEGRVGFGSGLGRREGAEVVRAIWDLVWERWQDVVQRAQMAGMEREGARTVGDRFQPGHVLTRIIYKGAYALGVLHDYDEECDVLRALLAQKVWRRGKRGAWYERLALILMTHYKGPQQEAKRCEALEVCIDGLEDDDTHLIYRPSLARRLARLENLLNLPYKDRHICDGTLAEAPTVTLSAVRIRTLEPTGDGADNDDDDAEPVAAGGGGGGWGGGAGRKKVGENGTTWGAKSAWLGRDGSEVGVEQWVLEQWENKGWKGFHAEGSIVTTIFGLLFWDVVFADVPGVFETPYQSAPLDLGEDTFALARSDLVKQRLADIASGKAPAILAEVDARERDKGTLCVGVRWDFDADDLREIVECLGGPSLEVVCRMLSEEYGHRSSGVPDLLVWNHEEKRARFVEVKGPGDRLSSTQQVWLDVLIGAGVEAEVCKVVEAGNEGLRSMSRSASPLKRRLTSPDWPNVEEDGASAVDDRPPNFKRRKSVVV